MQAQSDAWCDTQRVEEHMLMCCAKSELCPYVSRESCYARVVKGVDSKSTAVRRSGSNPDGSGFVLHGFRALTGR